jgi:tetratricopeptide (TPR) repeat protein
MNAINRLYRYLQGMKVQTLVFPLISATLILFVVFVISTDGQTKEPACSDPKNPKVIEYVTQALQAENKNDLQAAIDANKKVLEIEPKNECALNTIAGLYGKMENFNLEILWAKRALESNPSFVNAYLNLGNAQGSIGNFSLAEQTYKKASELEPKNPLPIYSLGVMAEQQEKFSRAIDFYKRSIQIDPKFENGYFNLAAMYANVRKFAEAKSVLRELLTLNPNAQDAKDMLRQIEREKP